MTSNDGDRGNYVRPEDRIRQGARGGGGQDRDWVGPSYLDELEERVQRLEAWRDAEEARRVQEEYAAHQEDVERREREG